MTRCSLHESVRDSKVNGTWRICTFPAPWNLQEVGKLSATTGADEGCVVVDVLKLSQLSPNFLIVRGRENVIDESISTTTWTSHACDRQGVSGHHSDQFGPVSAPPTPASHSN